MEENIRDLIVGTGIPYTIPDCFFTSQREGNGRWWDDVQDDRNEEVAVSRMSFLDADYHMDYWGGDGEFLPVVPGVFPTDVRDYSTTVGTPWRRCGWRVAGGGGSPGTPV